MSYGIKAYKAVGIKDDLAVADVGPPVAGLQK